MQKTIHVLFRTILIAAFALWFGGFIFYVSFVVPIGSRVLNSARTQGFITQEVTHWLNLVCGIAVAMMLAESAISWKQSRPPWRGIQLTAVLACLAMLGGLIWIHPLLDGLIDLENGKITNRQRFHGLHRVYLWLCTLQWAAACVWLPIAIASWENRERKLVNGVSAAD